MNKWKELEIDNLPPDILTGDYEIRWNAVGLSTSTKEYFDMENPLDLLKLAYQGVVSVTYRKPEPKQPSHEELQKRISDTLAYLNCGHVHEYDIINKLLKGIE